MLIGALEAGGTKMVLGIFSENGDLLRDETFPTEDPSVTMPKIVSYFSENHVDAIGVACFGPLDLINGSKSYGSITSTPKVAWRGFPLLTELRKGIMAPCAIDTDVNASVLAEMTNGAAKELNSAVYVTVGTGIGGGICVNGKMVRGLLHTEVGHMLLRPHPDDPVPRGVCPYHDGCLEGLASGPSIGIRNGTDARSLPDDHPFFDIEAYYLAQMCVNLILMVSPERIILGGGVMRRKSLFEKTRQSTVRLLGGYIQHPSILEEINNYIVEPKLFPISGLFGAFLLGVEALDSSR